MKKTIGILTIILLLISLMPSRVFAYTAYQIPPTDYTVLGVVSGSNIEWKRDSSVEVRTVAINSNNVLRVYAVSYSRNMICRFKQGGTSNGIQTSNALSVDDTLYYYNFVYYGQDTLRSNFITAYTNIYASQTTTETDNTELAKLAIYYTFGDGAETFSYGDLKNLGFYTKFVNSQQSNISQMALNKDVITWDQFQDTNGNDLNDINLRVDIQVATIDYEANTKSDLINQTLNDIVTGNWSELVSISPNVGKYEITWDQVAQQLWHSDNITIDFWNSLFNIYDSARGVFFKNGWIYRVRLRTADNTYVGQWQTVYNITSMPPADSDKVYTNYYVYNYTVPNEDTYEIIQNINNINNTENNWYQNDQPFNPETAGDNWLSKLIEAILSFLGQLIHDILGLFTFESFEIPDFESNKINIINNTGLFGETLQFTDQLKQAIEDVEYVEPVLTYPGLTIDDVQLIQPMTFNLNDYVQNEEIQDIRSLAYLVTDGFIYLCLVLLIKNKIMGVLKK